MLQSGLPPRQATKPGIAGRRRWRDRLALLRSRSLRFSAQAEEGKNRKNDDNQADKINDLVHVPLLGMNGPTALPYKLGQRRQPRSFSSFSRGTMRRGGRCSIRRGPIGGSIQF